MGTRRDRQEELWIPGEATVRPANKRTSKDLFNERDDTVAAAALSNAIFDATGARIREIPFTPERVKAALAAGT